MRCRDGGREGGGKYGEEERAWGAGRDEGSRD